MPNYPDSDAALDRALGAAPPGTRTTLRQDLTLPRPWRPQPDTVKLNAEYHLVADNRGERVSVQVEGHTLALHEPVVLEPAYVPKPWGREIWLTGIEARGESSVRTGSGSLALSRYLALAPRRLAGRAPLVLLKVLDPKPQKVLGDLYFETHEHKQEVYVVSHVDAAAWPDGQGRIRFGMNQGLRRQYADDEAFRRDYLAAVRAYEQVRRAIDNGADVPAGREAELRGAMESFTELRNIGVGDVVVVPTWLPHSLQHGVRVIEFQTPTYERFILSFAQKVLTQNHWDTAEAVARMRLDAPPPPRFDTLGEGVERIVAFDDFRVWRVRLAPGAKLTLPAHPSYALCMVVEGGVTMGPLTLAAEEAAFVPALALADAHRETQAQLHNPSNRTATVLLAAPDL